jgi:hypothetical protein
LPTHLKTKKSMKTITRKYSMATALGAVTLASMLAACGGGTGNGIVAPLLETVSLQGIWNSGSVGGEEASMVVLASGASWLLVNSKPVQLTTVTLKGTDSAYSGVGKKYIGSAAAPATVSFSATVTPKSILKGTVTDGVEAKLFSFSYDKRYETPAQLSDIAGTWAGGQDSEKIQFVWTLASDGALTSILASNSTSNSTSGCGYAGNVKVHADGAVAVGVFDLTLKETCNDVIRDFAGIATINDGKAMFAFSNATGSAGNFLVMTKTAP